MIPPFFAISIPILAFLVAIYKFKAVWRDGRWNTDSLAFNFWMFSLCVAVSMSFLIESFYLIFDAWIGVTNLGWLITYITMALAFYYISSGCYVVYNRPKPRAMSVVLIITLLIMVVLYPIGIITLPEKADHTLPETFLEFLFMQTMYLYVASFCLIPGYTFLNLYRIETVIASRLRLGVALTTIFMACIAATLKVGITIWVYIDPNTPVLQTVSSLVGSTIGLGGILWPLAFLPNHVFIFLSRPFVFLGKLRALKELKSLQNQLNHICEPVIADHVNLVEYLRNLDFHLYRTLIGILDGKSILFILAQKTAGLDQFPFVNPGILFRANQKSPEYWDEQDWQQARRLHHTLQSVNDCLEFPELVKAYVYAGRVLRQEAR